jgi:2-enoate reductase
MKLFERGKIGTISLKNRIVMDAINNQLVNPTDPASLNQRAVDFYVARAKGGVGLIKTACMQVHTGLEPSIGLPVINDVRNVRWLNDLAEAVHDYGAKVCVQLTPGAGRNFPPKPGVPHGGLIGPSPIPSFRNFDGTHPRIGSGRYPAQSEKPVIVRELSIKEIEQIVKDYEFSAKIVRQAGIDAIEIHGHAGYLLDQFLTPLWNQRTDKYGGDLDGRLTFTFELIQAIKRGAGTEFPILLKYSLTHYMEGGRDIEEGLEIAKRLESAGVNALTINGGCWETHDWTIPPTYQSRGCTVDLSEMVKKVVSIPVMAVGKLGYPDLAESVLVEGKADFISLARYLLADPEWANKVKEGRPEDIIPCLGCDEGCEGRIRKGKVISCAVNPTTGFEKALAITQAERKKIVLVIGGGPGGMEAARVSALRGHQVTLWEKETKLGGQLLAASVPDFKDDYKLLVNYLSNQISKVGVTVEFEKEATLPLIESFNPDVVFIATGAIHEIPDIEGIHKGIEDGRVITAIDALSGRQSVGKSIIVIGGGMIGCETGLHFGQRGKNVTIVKGRPIHTLEDDVPWGNALSLMKSLDHNKVKILDNTRVLRITKSGVDLVNQSGEQVFAAADTIVLASGMKPKGRELEEALRNKHRECYAFGDCVNSRIVLNAMWEGYRIARLI